MLTPDAALEKPLSDLEEAGRRLRRVVPEAEWEVHRPFVEAIAEWKRLRRAVVLAHNYMAPEIYHGVADLRGDSLALAQQAVATDAEVIVLAGVHFMAETAKLLNPERTVLIPDLEAGRVDHRGRCAPAAAALPGDPGGHLCEHLGRGKGGVRHLLHLLQRG